MSGRGIASPASDAVLAAQHPSPEQGGPCATCAFRPGTEASETEHTAVLARLCVEGGRQFWCHEKTQLCRGWIAAVNLRGVPFNEMAGACADYLGDAVEDAARPREGGAR